MFSIKEVRSLSLLAMTLGVVRATPEGCSQSFLANGATIVSEFTSDGKVAPLTIINMAPIFAPCGTDWNVVSDSRETVTFIDQIQTCDEPWALAPETTCSITPTLLVPPLSEPVTPGATPTFPVLPPSVPPLSEPTTIPDATPTLPVPPLSEATTTPDTTPTLPVPPLSEPVTTSDTTPTLSVSPLSEPTTTPDTTPTLPVPPLSEATTTPDTTPTLPVPPLSEPVTTPDTTPTLPVPPLSEPTTSPDITPTLPVPPLSEPTTTQDTKKADYSQPPFANLVLPTWEQIFNAAPRNMVPVTNKLERYLEDQTVGQRLLGKTMRFVWGALFSRDALEGLPDNEKQIKEKEREMDRNCGIRFKKWEEDWVREFGKELPKSWQIEEAADTAPTTPMRHIPFFGLGSTKQGDLRSSNKGSQTEVGSSGIDEYESKFHSHGMNDVLRGCKRVVVIGIHGWFPAAKIWTVVGESTGTSTKFVNMTEQALHHFEDEHGVKLEKITKIPLEGNTDTVDKRVERLYNNLIANEEWMSDIHEADAIIVSTHSQGSIVSTHLLNRLIQDNHITTSRNHDSMMSSGTGAETFPSAIGMPETNSRRKSKVQRVCCMALCGIHLGPLRYLSFVQRYIERFDSAAGGELFEFQNTESDVSKAYVKALQNVLDHGVKMLYIASLDDQVVPIYSGLFTAISHPLILRALYIDRAAYNSSDFLSNLLVLLIRTLNSGISDSGLIAHLSDATAGSLRGVGHSTAYEELKTFSLAVNYLFLANEGIRESKELHLEPFNANQRQNDYEIPWSLRDVIADERVLRFFSHNIAELRDTFREWHPKTKTLKDLKRKLQPITRLPNSTTNPSCPSTSKS